METSQLRESEKLMKPEAKEKNLLFFFKRRMGRLQGEKKKKLLYHVSTANQEYLAFGLQAHKRNASVTAQRKGPVQNV